MGMNRKQVVSGILRQAITDSGRSLHELAAASGVDDGRLSRFVRGERGLTTAAIDSLCDCLGLTLKPIRRPKRRSLKR